MNDALFPRDETTRGGREGFSALFANVAKPTPRSRFRLLIVLLVVAEPSRAVNVERVVPLTIGDLSLSLRLGDTVSRRYLPASISREITIPSRDEWKMPAGRMAMRGRINGRTPIEMER